MWLKTQDTIPNIKWERRLEVDVESAAQRLERSGAEHYSERELLHVARDLPVVSIGQPEVWPLPVVYPPDKMPLALRAKLDEADFYLVRWACSFRPVRTENRVVWARFLVNLLSDDASRQPIAYDLHPLQIIHEVKRNVEVALNPTLKFLEVEGGIGELAFGLEYLEIQPMISAAGAGQADPSWDYEAVKGTTVQGAKWMHLLLKVPRGMEQVEASLDLVADIEAQRVTLQGFFITLQAFFIRNKDQASEQLKVRLV